MPNATRRQGREWAVQMLFQADLNPDTKVEHMIETFWQQQWSCHMDESDQKVPTPKQLKKPVPDRVAPHDIREFTEKRVRGVLKHLDEIDEALENSSSHWELFRIGTVERNVLRLGYYELVYCPDVPPPVVLNEAVDLANYFSNSEAGRFVNGILDPINKKLQASRSSDSER